MKKKSLFFTLLLIFSSLFSFAQTKNLEKNTKLFSDTIIYNKIWTLQRMNNHKVKPATPNEKITLIMTSENEYVSGCSSCNTYVGKVIKKRNKLMFKDIGTTRMSCPEETLTNERQYLENLNKIDSFQIIDEDLYLYSKDKPILVFSKE